MPVIADTRLPKILVSTAAGADGMFSMLCRADCDWQITLSDGFVLCARIPAGDVARGRWAWDPMSQTLTVLEWDGEEYATKRVLDIADIAELVYL